MKKIILAFDGDNFSQGAFEFAAWLHEQDNILLSGIFLPAIAFNNLAVYPDGMGAVPLYIAKEDEEHSPSVISNIERFSSLCQKKGIEYRVHKDFTDFPLPELMKETRYADLLILGSETFYEELGTAKPNIFLENMLHRAECPVLVVPEKFLLPQSVVLSYNGSRNSVYAIKQFAYLLPELADKPTLIICSENEDEQFPDQSNIEELAARHFRELSFVQTNGKTKEYFESWTIQRSSPIMVAGSYGRSSFSQIFKKSFIREIIMAHKTPVFIAHW